MNFILGFAVSLIVFYLAGGFLDWAIFFIAPAIAIGLSIALYMDIQKRLDSLEQRLGLAPEEEKTDND